MAITPSCQFTSGSYRAALMRQSAAQSASGPSTVQSANRLPHIPRCVHRLQPLAVPQQIYKVCAVLSLGHTPGTCRTCQRCRRCRFLDTAAGCNSVPCGQHSIRAGGLDAGQVWGLVQEEDGATFCLIRFLSASRLQLWKLPLMVMCAPKYGHPRSGTSQYLSEYLGVGFLIGFAGRSGTTITVGHQQRKESADATLSASRAPLSYGSILINQKSCIRSARLTEQHLLPPPPHILLVPSNALFPR